MWKRLPVVAAVALATALVTAPAGAQDGGQAAQSFSAELADLNDSGGSGTATVSVEGQQLTVNIQAQGHSPNAPHAQHIHIGGTNECPGPEVDQDGDGLVNTAEGQPAYGEVRVSLTTEGDTSAASTLAVERFPVADESGAVNYNRTFDLPEGVTPDDVSNGVVVQHGISTLFGDPAAYDGDAVSPLDESLPLEATIPATCGPLTAGQVEQMPAAAPATGFGGTAGGTSTALPLAIAAGLVAGIGTLVVRRTLLAQPDRR